MYEVEWHEGLSTTMFMIYNVKLQVNVMMF